MPKTPAAAVSTCSSGISLWADAGFSAARPLPACWPPWPCRLAVPRDDGTTVLVSRGFVPADKRDPASVTVEAMCQEATISIMVNGEPRQIPGPATVADLLARIGLDTRKVAVERNLEIVPRSTYAATALEAGDQLEIVHFIGGG